MASNSSGMWTSSEAGEAAAESEERLRTGQDKDTNGGAGYRKGVETSGGTTGELVMRVGNYVCPARHVNDFTPLEFEEVINQP